MLIENEVKSQKVLFEGLEPEKKGCDKRKKAAFAASLPTWLRVVEAIRTWIGSTEQMFHVPELMCK